MELKIDQDLHNHLYNNLYQYINRDNYGLKGQVFQQSLVVTQFQWLIHHKTNDEVCNIQYNVYDIGDHDPN